MENEKFKNISEYVEHLIERKDQGEELSENENTLIDVYWIKKTLDIG